MTDRLLTMLGDDFTGSTDVMLQYHRLGLDGVLFLGIPEPEELAAAAEKAPVVGIATTVRSLPTSRMRPVVEAGLRQLATLDPLLVQYKVCSTADSSPDVGSFEPAISAGRRLFGPQPVPVLVAQPSLGRYTAFGNHFARDANGIHRLDRLPAMAAHPVTPMLEADLRVHVGSQLGATVGGLSLVELRSMASADPVLRRIGADGHQAFVIDAVDDDDLAAIGRLLLDLPVRPLFAVGSGGLSTAIGRALVGADSVPPRPFAPVAALLVVSGTTSAQGLRQIEAAVAAGWVSLPLDVGLLGHGPAAWLAQVDVVAARAVEALEDDPPGVIVHTASAGHARGEAVDVVAVGESLARMVLACRAARGVTRVLIAGGDTSGHVITALEADRLTVLTSVAEDLLLGRLSSRLEDVDGLEVVLKGGQLGPVDLFEQVRAGRGRPSEPRSE